MVYLINGIRYILEYQLRSIEFEIQNFNKYENKICMNLKIRSYVFTIFYSYICIYICFMIFIKLYYILKLL